MATNKLIVENAKATVKAAEAKAVEVKETVKKADETVKATAKKATKTAKATTKKAATTAKKTVKTVKTAAKKATATTYAEIQFAGKNYTMDEIVKIAMDACKAANKRKTITDIKVYVKPEESKVYYVANDGAFIGAADL